MDPIRPIAPHDPIEIEPVLRVERASDRDQRQRQKQDHEQDEEQKRKRAALLAGEVPEGTPTRGEDGEQHIDVRV